MEEMMLLLASRNVIWPGTLESGDRRYDDGDDDEAEYYHSVL